MFNLNYMARKVDWEKIKAEYVTGDISVVALAHKYGVNESTAKRRATREGWIDTRKKHRESVVKKATKKAATKQANELAKELTLLDKIERALDKALSDADQFNRHIVTEGTGKGATVTEERIFSKADMRALKDAAQVLTMVESMKKERLEQEKDKSMTVKFEDQESDEWGD